jgi:hypothetical protein
MFSKLAQKYKVSDPLYEHGDSKNAVTGNVSAFGVESVSPFTSAYSPSPFGAAQKPPLGMSPFAQPSGQQHLGGQSVSASSASPFSTNSPSTAAFGSVSSPAPAFGQQNLISSPFGQPTASVPFGADPTPAPAAAQTHATMFGGKSARELLTSFYQEKNPSKLGEVDKLLAKYQACRDLQKCVLVCEHYDLSHISNLFFSCEISGKRRSNVSQFSEKIQFGSFCFWPFRTQFAGAFWSRITWHWKSWWVWTTFAFGWWSHIWFTCALFWCGRERGRFRSKSWHVVKCI